MGAERGGGSERTRRLANGERAHERRQPPNVRPVPDLNRSRWSNWYAARSWEVVESGGYLLKPFTHAQMQGLVDGGTIDRTMLKGLHELGRKFPALASAIYVNARRR